MSKIKDVLIDKMNAEVAKKRIKELKGKTIQLGWKHNGWGNSCYGTVENIREKYFIFVMNNELNKFIDYEWIYKIELITKNHGKC